MKPVWSNKFGSPSAEELVGGIKDAEQRELVIGVRDMLQEAGGREAVRWEGVPWCWTLVYDLPGNEGAGAVAGERPTAWAYLVPEPARPQLCLPIRTAQVEDLGIRRAKRFIRDAVVHARVVLGVCWPCWTLENRGEVDDLRELVVRSARILNPTGRGAAG